MQFLELLRKNLNRLITEIDQGLGVHLIRADLLVLEGKVQREIHSHTYPDAPCPKCRFNISGCVQKISACNPNNDFTLQSPK